MEARNINYIMDNEKKEKANLIVGVTGGIASGKTTVTKILEGFGVPLIDFDVLARKVVEPDTKALKGIVEYFGEKILEKNGSLNRKKLSRIVFQNPKKRKKLEDLTHPPIYNEFTKEIEYIRKRQPNSIIQVSVPLLVEKNLQYMFHKILVVYLKREEQIRRLALRENIFFKEAEDIVKSQLPIEEKLKWADYIIYNDNSLEETRLQVEKLWKQLRAFK